MNLEVSKIPVVDELVMEFDLNTLDHLGAKLYNTLPPMIAELVSNAWDADAEIVKIFLNDSDRDEKSIIIEDDGLGMTFEELQLNYLKIGRNRRVTETSDLSPQKKRPVVGKKGLGKLSMFGIAKNIEVISCKNGYQNRFIMNSDDIKNSEKTYKPRIIEKNLSCENHGTKINLTNIFRKTSFDPQNLAKNLAKRFSFYSKDFQVVIYHNNKLFIVLDKFSLLEHLRVEFSWKFPEDFTDDLDSNSHLKFLSDNGVAGEIITAATPLSNAEKGLILFARGKLAQENAYFADRSNDYFHAYLAGYLNIDFIDKDFVEDNISTGRSSLTWEIEEMQVLKEALDVLLRKISTEWKPRRVQIKQAEIKSETNIDIKEWLNDLSPSDKLLGRQIAEAIIMNPEIDTDYAKSLFIHVQDAFSYESFKNYAAQLNDLDILESEPALKLLADWQYVEAKEFAKVAEGRIKTIEQFAKYIAENASETKVMQKFLEAFPWLLDPKMAQFEREVTFRKLLLEAHPDQKLEEKNRRLDFLCTNNSGVYHIIELKRPHIQISVEEIIQISSYYAFARDKLPSDCHTIKCYLISDKCKLDSIAELQAQGLIQSGVLEIKSYTDLLIQAERYHKEFIKLYEELKEKKRAPQN